MQKPEPKYATTKNQLIQAILGEHFRFASETQARKKLEALAKDFTISTKHRPTNLVEDALFLWIKGLEVSDKDQKKGYKGNFAGIYFKKLSTGKFTLYHQKIDIDIKHHPQQQRRKTSHPNWGHPILRQVKKGKKYDSIALAQKDLEALHEEYPTTTIPLGTKLNIMVYSKAYGHEKPIKKHALEIKAHQEGGFIIEIAERTEKLKYTPPPIKNTNTPNSDLPAEPMGKFTSMVQLKRAKKKKK